MGGGAGRLALPARAAAADHEATSLQEPLVLDNLINGLLNLALFCLPIPLLLWADRPGAAPRAPEEH